VVAVDVAVAGAEVAVAGAEVAAVAAEAAVAAVAAAAGAAAVTEAAAYRGAAAVFVESMQFLAHRQKKEGAVGGSTNDPANCLRHSPFATCPHRDPQADVPDLSLLRRALCRTRLKQPKTSRRTFLRCRPSPVQISASGLCRP
jgi:hypothetical protein